MNQSPHRILVLDDDYESMEPLKLFLETVHGFDVELTAAQGILDRLPYERFDLICVDLMIHPTSLNAHNEEVENIHFSDINWQQTGLEFLKRLRQGEFNGHETEGTSPDTPVIMLSAVATQAVNDVFKHDIQPLQYMEKPFDLAEMMDCIEQMLEDI